MKKKISKFERWFAYFIIAELIDSTITEPIHAMCISLWNRLSYEQQSIIMVEVRRDCPLDKAVGPFFPEFIAAKPAKPYNHVFWFDRSKEGNEKRVALLRKLCRDMERNTQ